MKTRKSRKSKANGHSKPRKLRQYENYKFRDRDPVMDTMFAELNNAGITLAELGKRSNVSRTTFNNWWKKRKTRRPQFATCAETMGAIGRRFTITKIS